jgi:hypothetical protein
LALLFTKPSVLLMALFLSWSWKKPN